MPDFDKVAAASENEHTSTFEEKLIEYIKLQLRVIGIDELTSDSVADAEIVNSLNALGEIYNNFKYQYKRYTLAELKSPHSSSLDAFPRVEYEKFARVFQELLVIILRKKIEVAEATMYFQDEEYKGRIERARDLLNQLDIGVEGKPRSGYSAWLEEIVKQEISVSSDYKKELAGKEQRDAVAARAASQAEQSRTSLIQNIRNRLGISTESNEVIPDKLIEWFSSKGRFDILKKILELKKAPLWREGGSPAAPAIIIDSSSINELSKEFSEGDIDFLYLFAYLEFLYTTNFDVSYSYTNHRIHIDSPYVSIVRKSLGGEFAVQADIVQRDAEDSHNIKKSFAEMVAKAFNRFKTEEDKLNPQIKIFARS